MEDLTESRDFHGCSCSVSRSVGLAQIPREQRVVKQKHKVQGASGGDTSMAMVEAVTVGLTQARAWTGAGSAARSPNSCHLDVTPPGCTEASDLEQALWQPGGLRLLQHA